MQTEVVRDFIKLEDYLAGESASEVKHEFIGGSLYAMSGASTEHNQIALNMAVAFWTHLRGEPFRVFVSDVKVRLEISGDDAFYYPDVMVGCDSRDTHRLYLRFPKLLVEVASESTERLDRR
jgi:Uma2 family endonuclease